MLDFVLKYSVVFAAIDVMLTYDHADNSSLRVILLLPTFASPL